MEIEEVVPVESQKKKGKEKPLQPKKTSSLVKKLDPAAARLLLTLREKANKKTFGRKVRDPDILLRALKLVEPQHLLELQEATLSEKDRLLMAHEDYQKANGKLTRDQFIGKLMRGEITKAWR